MMKILDASVSRPLDGGPSCSFANRACRLVWNVVWFVLASWTPARLYPWRRFLLQRFGARMAARTDVCESARVWYPPYLIMEERTILADGVNCYNMAPIHIKSGAVVSQRAHLCAGYVGNPAMPKRRRSPATLRPTEEELP